MGFINRISNAMDKIETMKESALVRLEEAAVHAEERREKSRQQSIRIQKIKEGLFGKRNDNRR